MINLYADVDARSMTPSRNTRSYTLRSVPSSPGRSFFNPFPRPVTGITCEPLIAVCQVIFEVMSSNLSEERANAKQGSVQ